MADTHGTYVESHLTELLAVMGCPKEVREKIKDHLAVGIYSEALYTLSLQHPALNTLTTSLPRGRQIMRLLDRACRPEEVTEGILTATYQVVSRFVREIFPRLPAERQKKVAAWVAHMADVTEAGAAV